MINTTTLPPTDEKKWIDIKNRRNAMLDSCDWTQLPDANLTEDEVIKWQVYRQELRDIPQDFIKPESIKWPIQP